MIDLRTYRDNWRMPDGSMALAHAKGTQDSGGRIPERINDPPDAQAVLVSGGPHFIFCFHERSAPVRLADARRVAARYGYDGRLASADDIERISIGHERLDELVCRELEMKQAHLETS